jgi:hypothetical protein
VNISGHSFFFCACSFLLLLICLDVITFVLNCEPRLTAANALAARYCCRVSTGPAGESVALKLFTSAQQQRSDGLGSSSTG